MNNTQTNGRLSPCQVITVYTDKARHEFYLEQREVKLIGGKATLMAAVPMAEDALKEVAKAYVKSSGGELEHDGIIPAHILYTLNKPGKTIVIWYRPAMERVLNFSQSLVKGEARVKVPATLYAIEDRNLYVYALMQDERPDQRTKLYGAPFFNIYKDGRVCLGTAQLGTRSRSYDGETERYERAFYMAEQNGGIQEHCKTPLPKLWTALAKKPTPFPSDKELKQHPTYKTLGHLISGLAGNKSRNASY